MSVECTGRNVEVTASLQELARRRTLRLERHLGGPAVVRVVLSHEKHRFGAEVIASHRRRHWKAQEETSGDPRAAVALAFGRSRAGQEGLEARTASTASRPGKGSGRPCHWNSRRPIDLLAARTAARVVPAGPRRVAVKPMSIEEASQRLDSSRREILVFGTRPAKLSILYRRADGDFGLIVPE
jgi:ribosome-associated translation inhibitor RaiA